MKIIKDQIESCKTQILRKHFSTLRNKKQIRVSSTNAEYSYSLLSAHFGVSWAHSCRARKTVFSLECEIHKILFPTAVVKHQLSSV